MQNSGVFRVFVNQVDVGSIPEQDYRAILAEVAHEVKADRWLYLAQVVNLVSCVYRAAWTLVKIVPLILFLIFATALFAAPEAVTNVIANTRAATPAEVTSGLQQMFYTLALFATIALTGSAALSGYRFGYINQFDSARSERTNLRIRALLEVPAEGKMQLQVGKGFCL